MFFTSEPSLPFETIREGMNLYPDWKLIVIEGDANFFQDMASTGDSDYIGTLSAGLPNSIQLYEPRSTKGLIVSCFACGC
jgi:hypothetical protein